MYEAYGKSEKGVGSGVYSCGGVDGACHGGVWILVTCCHLQKRANVSGGNDESSWKKRGWWRRRWKATL